ncbi:MAG: hypothetical protein CMI56_03155 [Parcubacteria group bacterium]|nr:hypothetical protein [Parcubacteria group bacterium]
MEMLTIYTHNINPAHKEFWKSLAQKIIGKYSGPTAVRDSVLRGLNIHTIEHELNPLLAHGDTLLVLSGVNALRKAIRFKESGNAVKLIAGPNIVTTPNDAQKIMCNDAIDILLVPSEWVANFWKHEAPEIAHKIHTWAAGVPKANASTRNGLPIVYNKMLDTSLLVEVKKVFSQNEIDYTLFTYGTFKHSEYLKALRDAPFVVYLSQSESQGLALQEAWTHDVPTLINRSTTWRSNGFSWEAHQINCPYLTPELGVTFGDAEEILKRIEHITSLHPKHYCDEYLSDSVSTQKLLNIL